MEGNRRDRPIRVYPEPGSASEGLHGVPADEIARTDPARDRIWLTAERTVDAVGIGFAGIIREGRIEESPNLQQVKGFHLQEML